MLALAADYDMPVDVPFRELTTRHLELIREGVPERDFGGLQGFFKWLERRKYKMHLRVFLSRWRSYCVCTACGGSRLRSEALATRVGGKNIAELSQMKICDALEFIDALNLSPWQRQVSRVTLEQVESRLGFLNSVGLGYMTLDRTLRTLSGGEAQRVALTSALGSSLVNMLYVLDEPSVGLHPRDIDRLLQAIVRLRDRHNTVVVVEHEESFIRAADQIVEIGPGAGENGGRIVFQGTLAEMQSAPDSLTGDYLAGRRGLTVPQRRRAPDHGWIRLVGASGNNLKNVTAEFPLGVLCLITGVSGSGKSTLVQDTLYPALRRRKRKEAPKPLPFEDVFGDGQIDEVILVDQSPIGRSPRSNPVTYVKAFDAIRAVFADTVEARTHNYTAGHFSFNADLGRCSACKGEGYVQIDMQFLADVYMKCSQCGGRRYRQEILAVTYRGVSIADVLEMTVRQAFGFFRGQPKVQQKLKRLIDVGLDYLRLGQPANTLSAGEAQRLKLAAYLSAAKRNRTLFLLDEPTTGLHFSDIVQLLGLLRRVVVRGALAPGDRTQPATDEGRGLHHRPGTGRCRSGRTNRRAGNSGSDIARRGLPYRAIHRRGASATLVRNRLTGAPTPRRAPRMTWTDQLCIFHGEATPATARVYVRLDAQDARDVSLEGTVTGPYCAYATTLPATVALQNLGPDPAPLAAATIVDPCFWSAGMPFYYHVQAQVCRQDCVLESVDQEIGIGRLGARDRSLYVDGRRWVLRGAEREQVEAADLAAWREASLALVAADPAPDLCQTASEVGVPIVARLPQTGDLLIDRLRQLAPWAAVGMAIVQDESLEASVVRQAVPNLLLAQCVAPASPLRLKSWAQIAICEVGGIDDFACRTRDCAVPVVAYRRLPNRREPAAARAVCDQLQRDLAPLQDVAGYIV